MAAIPTKPYLIRALYEWCADNGFRPYIAVSVDEHTVVPRESVSNGEIVLNISAAATHGLVIGNELIEFEARFNGAARRVSIPIDNVSAIFAQENGHGMAFEVARAPGAGEAAAPGAADPSGDAREPQSPPAVQGGDEGSGAGERATQPPDAPAPGRRKPKLAAVPEAVPEAGDPPPKAPRRRGGPKAVAPASPGGRRPDGDEPDPASPPTPPGPPRLTRVK